MYVARRCVVRRELQHFAPACKAHSRRTFTTSSNMERPAGTSAALYATVSTTTTQNAVPEDAKAKAHHLKDGKGFTNPWPSFRDFTPTSILWAMLKYCYTALLDEDENPQLTFAS